MCRKIRCDGKSCKVLDFWVYLNKALVLKEADKWMVFQAKDMLICWMTSFKPSLVMLTDVFKI